MAIHIRDGGDSYKELSKIFLKQIDSYTEICKVFICTGPGQYELLFDTCEGEACLESDEECSDCLPRWLTVHDDLLLDTDGPTPEGLSRIICPTTACAYSGLDTSCLEDEVCCNCGLDIYDQKVGPTICQTLFQPNCPCIKLDTTNCNALPEYINNTCKAYVWAALGGTLQSPSTYCKSCIDSTQTVIGKCCRYGRRYSYIQKATWNNDPNTESDCGIKRNCPTYDFLVKYEPTGNYTDIIDYGYETLTEIQGGIAEEPDPGNPQISFCPYNCNNPLSSCYVNCSCFGNTEQWCQQVCTTTIGTRCEEIWNQYITTQTWDEYVCQKCADYPKYNCCPDNPPPEGCDICTIDPCTKRCIINCGEETIDWCSVFCTSNTEINWQCLLTSGDGLSIGELITFIRNKGCDCYPDWDGCNDICYDYYGTDDAN